jgi:hypothetical protein
MYELKISLRPKLVLKTFDNVYSTALFCKKSTRDNISQTYFELKKDSELDYILFMAGDCDFFITTKKEFVNVNKYDIEIVVSLTARYYPI